MKLFLNPCLCRKLVQSLFECKHRLQMCKVSFCYKKYTDLSMHDHLAVALRNSGRFVLLKVTFQCFAKENDQSLIKAKGL